MVSNASKDQVSSQTQNLHKEKKNYQAPFTGRTKKKKRETESTNCQTLEIAESMFFLTDEKNTKKEKVKKVFCLDHKIG